MREITSQEIAQLWDKTREIKKAIQEALPDKELEFSVGICSRTCWNTNLHGRVSNLSR